MKLKDLTEPDILKTAIKVHYFVNGKRFLFVCCRCKSRVILDPEHGFPAEENCLQVVGLQQEELDRGDQSGLIEMILPCRYMTNITLGPEIEVVSGTQTKRMIILPTCPPAEGAMALDQIALRLREFLDVDER